MSAQKNNQTKEQTLLEAIETFSEYVDMETLQEKMDQMFYLVVESDEYASRSKSERNDWCFEQKMIKKLFATIINNQYREIKKSA